MVLVSREREMRACVRVRGVRVEEMKSTVISQGPHQAALIEDN